MRRSASGRGTSPPGGPSIRREASFAHLTRKTAKTRSRRAGEWVQNRVRSSRRHRPLRKVASQELQRGREEIAGLPSGSPDLPSGNGGREDGGSSASGGGMRGGRRGRASPTLRMYFFLPFVHISFAFLLVFFSGELGGKEVGRPH